MEERMYVPLVKLTMVKEKEVPFEVGEINSPAQAAALAEQILSGVDREYLLVISVDNKCHPQAIEIVAIGTVNEAPAVPREIFKHAVLSNASGIILAHNHTSGNCEPSKEDALLTKRVEKAGKLLGIELQDHIIIGKGYFSFREANELKGGDENTDQEKADTDLEWLNKFISNERQEDVEKEIAEILELIQRKSYMEGYEYAIQVLNESMIKR